MRQLDRFNLVSDIGRELQSRMTYSDIDLYLSGYNVDFRKPTSKLNSKWIYVKELLSGESDEKILEIADELEIEHAQDYGAGMTLADSGYWLPNHFRLFISHLASVKDKAHNLKMVLEKYGITSFVAHDSIVPTQEWETEIQKALFSMDAMAVLLFPGFRESNWTDQEVGIALGRNVLVIPVRRGEDPYGFLGKIQGLQGAGKITGEVAGEIFGVLREHKRTRGALSKCLVQIILTERSLPRIKQLIKFLAEFDIIPAENLQMLQSQALENGICANNDAVVRDINSLLLKHGLSKVSTYRHQESDDDIPF